ncbi:hypothetical protein Tco_0530580 [Tanacetum coccineum]
MPQDSPLPRVNILGSDEGCLTLHDLMVLCTILSKKVESLDTDLKQTKLTYGVAYTKLIKKLENKVKSSQARRRDIIIVSNAEDDLEDPSKQGRKIAEIDQDPAISLDVSTTEKDISTAKPVSTAGAAVTTASVAISTTKDKGYEAAVRLEAKLEEEERQRIASVHEAASSFNIEEWDDIQARVEADEELVQRAYQSKKENMGAYTLPQLRGYSFDEIKNLFKTTMRRVHTFVPIESEIERVIPELAAGSSKRDAEEELDQESSKRQKT